MMFERVISVGDELLFNLQQKTERFFGEGVGDRRQEKMQRLRTKNSNGSL